MHPTSTAPTPSKCFSLRQLSVLMYANGFTVWHYKSPGPVKDTLAPGYFADAADLLAEGDQITVSNNLGGLVGFVLGTGRAIKLHPASSVVLGGE